MHLTENRVLVITPEALFRQSNHCNHSPQTKNVLCLHIRAKQTRQTNGCGEYRYSGVIDLFVSQYVMYNVHDVVYKNIYQHLLITNLHY